MTKGSDNNEDGGLPKTPAKATGKTPRTPKSKEVKTKTPVPKKRKVETEEDGVQEEVAEGDVKDEDEELEED